MDSEKEREEKEIDKTCKISLYKEREERAIDIEKGKEERNR